MKRKVNWLLYCRDHHVKLSGKIRNNEWLECQCVFCDDHHTHAAINMKSSGYYCWKCGNHTMNEFVSVTGGVPCEYRAVRKYLEPYYTDYVPRIEEDEKAKEERKTKVQLITTKGLTMPGSNELGTGVRKYIEKRGLNPDVLADMYGIKDGGIVGDWAYRLMIPVTLNGKVVAWQGRHIGHSKIRYKASSLSEALNIKNVVYNIDNCHYRKCIVVEGVFDCWKLGTDCIATFGISLKDSQIQFIADRFDEVYVLFDPEETATERARELARKLNNIGCKATVLYMESETSDDPGELTPTEVQEVKHLVFDDIKDYDFSTPWLLR